MKKIKVAHVLHSVGGVEVYLRLITQNINPKEVENIIIHQKNTQKKAYLNKDGERIKEFYIPVVREISFFKDLKSILKTIKYLKQEQPDIIHAHSAKGGIIARVASLFYKVSVLHTPHAYSYLSTQNKFKRFMFLTLERLFKYFNSILLATSNSERLRGLNEVHYKIEKALVVNNSILPLDDIKKNESLLCSKDYLCTVARPSYQKNLGMMIDVIYELKKEIPEIHLIILGVGEYSPEKDIIQEKIESLNLSDHVSMVKWMERKKTLEVIKGSKLYLSTSRYEGLPYSVIESLALSKACVVTKCDGNNDLIIDNYNGFKVELGDVKAMKNKVLELYTDNILRTSFEKNALVEFNKKYNLNHNILKLTNIYLQNIKDKT